MLTLTDLKSKHLHPPTISFELLVWMVRLAHNARLPIASSCRVCVARHVSSRLYPWHLVKVGAATLVPTAVLIYAKSLYVF